MNKKNNPISTFKKNLQRQASLQHTLDKIVLNPATNHQHDIKDLAHNYFLKMKNDEEVVFFIKNYNFDSIFNYIFSGNKRRNDKHSAEKSLYFILYFMEFSFAFHDEISLTDKLLGESVTVKKINFIELLKIVLELFYNFMSAINSIKSSVVYSDRYLIKINSNEKVIKYFYQNLQNINNKKDIILKSIFVKDWKTCLNIFYILEGKKSKLDNKLEKKLIKKSKKTPSQTKGKSLLKEKHSINSGSALNPLLASCIKNSQINTDFYRKDRFFLGKLGQAADHDYESIPYSSIPIYENDVHASNDTRIDSSSNYYSRSVDFYSSSESVTEDHDYESIPYSSIPIYENDVHASSHARVNSDFSYRSGSLDFYSDDESINNNVESDYRTNETNVKEPPLSEQLREALSQRKKQQQLSIQDTAGLLVSHSINDSYFQLPPSKPRVCIPGLNLKNQSYTLFSENKSRRYQHEIKLKNEQTESKNFE